MGRERIGFGAICGTVELPEPVRANAAALARRYYAEAEAAEFGGDAVETLRCPRWMAGRWAWFPDYALRQLGYTRAPRVTDREELVLTVGCDAHTDCFHGPVFFLVLHNDGLKFRQRGSRHVTEVGQWFVFDDRCPHQVTERADSTVYIGWSVGLVELSPESPIASARCG